MADASISLASLRGLRNAPQLQAAERQQLKAELEQAMAPCGWFTIGIMAPSAAIAVQTLRRWESAFAWQPLQAAATGAAEDTTAGAAPGAVFLKGHQGNGTFWLRPEAGLGEGVLITAQGDEQAAAGDTWGPLPLDLV